MYKCFTIFSLVMAMLFGMSQAQAEMQVEVGAFNGSAGMTHTWDAAEFGPVTADAGKGSASGSLATRYTFGNAGGLKFSVGSRVMSTNFDADFGAAAQAATASQESIKALADAEAATYDANGDGAADDAADDAAFLAAKEASNAATAEMARIDSVHSTSVDLSGINATVMKEHLLQGGKRVAYGYEGFKAANGGLVSAARVEYGSKHGPATWNVVANAGDGWGGVGLMIGF